MAAELDQEVRRIGRIEAVPSILEVVCRTTGMGFAAVARVTDDRWVACSVLDGIDFGLKPGGELRVETTICHEIRQRREIVVIDNVREDAEWCKHPTPAMYGFESYISAPIILSDGSFFGTLCAIDPRPARLNKPEVIGMFRLFAELIAKHLDADRKLTDTEIALTEERETAELREQFMAVLAHDLRTPMRAITSFSELMLRAPLDARTAQLAATIRNSARRMNTLIDNLLDLARGRRGGLTLTCRRICSVEPVLRVVVAELEASHPERRLEAEFSLQEPVNCDPDRIAQLASNLLGNALTYGSADQPVRFQARSDTQTFELSVLNAGEPIPAAVAAHLFEPFYRNSAVRHREGLGLGLYISHEIATAHGGTLTLESKEEETRFTFRMPTG